MVDVEVIEMIWVLMPQLSLVVALIVFRAIEAYVMEVREVLPHQVV